jgi:hypothetical protein
MRPPLRVGADADELNEPSHCSFPTMFNGAADAPHLIRVSVSEVLWTKLAFLVAPPLSRDPR